MKHREIALVSVRKLRPNKRNARTHPQKQIRQIQSNYRRFGWTSPIIVDEKNVILAGHGRYEAALQLGLLEVPVIVVEGLNDAEKRALALADNKIAENAGWDRKRLAEELTELANLLPECNLGLDITGFAPAEIDGLLGDLVDPELDPADEVPSPKDRSISKIGDLW
jgi:ParB-like chromosome segregation protein Spo0J